MKTFLSRLLPVVAVAATLGMSTRAHALGPIDVEVGALAGFMPKPANAGATDANNDGFGLGGRGGVAFFNIYGGVRGMYFFGQSDSHSYMYGIDGGYNLKIGPVTIRPQLGGGDFTLVKSGARNNHFYLEPGVVGLVTIGFFYVGLDVQYLVVFKNKDAYSLSTPAFDLQLGFSF